MCLGNKTKRDRGGYMGDELQQALKEMEVRIIKAINHELSPENQKEKRQKKVYHNAKKLLKNYSKFIQHNEIAEFTASTLIDKDLIDTLTYKMDEGAIDDVYIKSLFQTKERTAVMLNHINRVLEFYEYTANKENSSKKQRLSQVIQMIYIENMTAEQVASALNIDRSTVFKDINAAIDDIGPLLFGIDAIKMN